MVLGYAKISRNLLDFGISLYRLKSRKENILNLLRECKMIKKKNFEDVEFNYLLNFK